MASVAAIDEQIARLDPTYVPDNSLRPVGDPGLDLGTEAGRFEQTERDDFRAAKQLLGIPTSALAAGGQSMQPLLANADTVGPTDKPKLEDFFGMTPRVTSPFGPRTDPKTGKPANHGGTDYGTPIGTPITVPGAYAGGRVVAVGTNKKSGHFVIIELPWGDTMSFSHLSEKPTHLKENQTVTSGMLLGHTGRSGRVTGPHVHVGSKPKGGGKPLNPSDLFAE